jgi:RimJ/RimL family protein N-acetyltransferase
MDHLLRLIKKRIPIVWFAIETINNYLVTIFLGKAKKSIELFVVSLSPPSGIRFKPSKPNDAKRLSLFLQGLGSDDRQYFSPFSFTASRVEAMLRGGGFLFFSAERDGQIVGVFFLRLFFSGRAFLGFVVHRNARGLGIGKSMVFALRKGCLESGVRLFSSVSKHNIPSWKIHESCGFRVRKRINEEYMLLFAEGSNESEKR